MEQDVRGYFSRFASSGDVRLARYTGSQLARGGVENMEILCALLADSPEKLLKIRNIGVKSMAVIQRACERYLGEKDKERTK